MKIDYVIQGVKNAGKLDKAKILSNKLGISNENICYVGDDINCFELLSNVGYAACPFNAVKKIKEIPNILKLKTKGGDGAVREYVEYLLEKINMNIEYCTINFKLSIKEALLKIDKNTLGVVFAVDKKNKVIGCATDGDIRTSLLKGYSLDDEISSCMNKSFIYCNDSFSREDIIKLFDSSIKVIPFLSQRGELIKVLTATDFPIENENQVIARSNLLLE